MHAPLISGLNSLYFILSFFNLFDQGRAPSACAGVPFPDRFLVTPVWCRKNATIARNLYIFRRSSLCAIFCFPGYGFSWIPRPLSIFDLNLRSCCTLSVLVWGSFSFFCGGVLVW